MLWFGVVFFQVTFVVQEQPRRQHHYPHLNAVSACVRNEPPRKPTFSPRLIVVIGA